MAEWGKDISYQHKGGYGKRPRLDRFGNETMLVGLKIPEGKEYGRGFIEMKGQLYKVEVCGSKKDGVQAWVKLTKLAKRQGGGSW